VHLIFWDLGGQAGLRSIWDKYYAESNALIYLIDASAGPGHRHTRLCASPRRSLLMFLSAARDFRCFLSGIPSIAVHPPRGLDSVTWCNVQIRCIGPLVCRRPCHELVAQTRVRLRSYMNTPKGHSTAFCLTPCLAG